MKAKTIALISIIAGTAIVFSSAMPKPPDDLTTPVVTKRYLYVAVPGIRDYLGYGGHGILVFDIA